MYSLCRGPTVLSGGSAREVHHRKKNMEIIISIIILRAIMSEPFPVVLCQHMPPQHCFQPGLLTATLSSASSYAPSLLQ